MEKYMASGFGGGFYALLRFVDGKGEPIFFGDMDELKAYAEENGIEFDEIEICE